MTASDPVVESPAPNRRRRLVRLAGLALAVVALGLCGYALVRDGDEVLDALRGANLAGVALAVVLSFGSMAGLAVLWARCLRALGVRVSTLEVTGWYFVGELGKYVPGGVWQVVGRSELAHQRRGIARGTSYASTLLAYGVMCLGAALVCSVASPWLALSDHGTRWAWLLAPGVVVVVVATHPAVLGAGLRLASRLSRREAPIQALPWGTMLALVLWSLPAWVLLGAASSVLAVALHVEGNEVQVALAAVAAWLVGFLAIPVPAGAGVREIVFATFSGLAGGPAVAIALVARVVLVLVDAVGGVIGLIAHQVHDPRP